MQLWQQQLLSKELQLQELRRRHHLQQLDHEARQLVPQRQMSFVGKSATGDQLTAIRSEMPINNSYNYMWTNNYVGDLPNLPTNYQMVIAGNMNLVQPSHTTALQNLGNGDGTLNDCSRAMRSMGFVPQQNSHFIQGLPVPGTSSLDQYSPFLELSNNCNHLITNSDATVRAKSSNPSTIQSSLESTQQGFSHDNTLETHSLQDRNAYIKSPMQDLANGVAVGNFQQASNLHDQFQEFHGRQEQDDTSTNLQGKQVSEFENSVNVASLDPMEQKLLFGTDDDDNWGVLFGGSLMSGMGGNMHAHPVDNDHYGAFPSIQSGSWSALMQEAVQTSTSYKGQEEWSGLSKTEPVRTLLCATDDGKQPIGLDDDISHNQVSSTAQPFSLSIHPNATPSSLTAGNNSLLLKTACEENSTATTETSHVCLRSSLQGTNSKEFGNSQTQSRLVEVGVEDKISSTGENETKLIGAIRAKIPFPIGIWNGRSSEQSHNISENIQLKSQDNGNGNLGQQNLLLSNVPFQPVNSLGGWISSHAMESRGDTTSSYHRIPENHVNQGAGTQFVKPNIVSLKMQSEDLLAGNLGSVRHPNSLKSNQIMHQQVMDEQKSAFGRNFACNTRVTSDVDKDDEENQTRCNLSTTPATEVLSHDIGSQNSIHHGQLSMGPNIFQNSLGNLKKQAEPSFQPNHQLNLQSLPNSVFSGSNNIGRSFNGNSHFAGHGVGNNPNDTSERVQVEAEQSSVDARPLHPSSVSFDESRAQYTQNETISQASNNMLELLYKVDQSRNENSVNASDKAMLVDFLAARVHSDWSSNSRGFGLHLAPPSQRQSLPDKDPIYQKPLNGDMIGQSGYVEAGYQDQSQSSYTSLGQPLPLPDEASETANGHKISSLPGQQENEHLEANKYFNSSSVTASEFPLAQNHLQQQLQFPRQDRSGAQGHLQQQQEGHISNRNQANAGALMKQPDDSNDTAVPGEFQALPTLSSRFSASGVASNAQNHITCGSQFFSGRADHMKPTFAGFSQITNSGHQPPSVDTKQILQSSESGMSNQAGFSKLHNVWTTISAQQRQAGINPVLAPNVLQSLINHGRDRRSWGMPKAHSQLNKEESAPELSTCSSNSQKEENSAQIKSSNILEGKMDVVSRASYMFQGEETAALDGGSSVSVSSLVSLHQQNVNKAKHEHDLALRSQNLLSSLTSVISSRSGGICERMPKPSDGQQKNFSLLHQIQSTGASESDMNKLAENMLRGTSFNTPQMNLNVNQRFNHKDNSHSRDPPDVKVAAASHVSDAQMLSFNSNDHKEKDPRTSTVGLDDLQTHIHPLCTNSTATALGGNDCPPISPHMVPASFEHYGIYQNGRMVALYDAQKSVKASTQQYSLQNVPAGMEDSVIVEQRLDSIHAGCYGEGTLSSKISPNESLPLLPKTSDHGAILRPKKRKSLTMDMPWRKIVTECLQSLESISMAELSWNLSADRLMEKVDDEAEAVEDGPSSFPHSRRRLILTTQLMQQLVPAVQSELLNGKATSAYQSLSFVVAKSALADACSLVSSSKMIGMNHWMLGELRTSNMEDDAYLKFTEDIVTKFNKLEADFPRLEKETFLLDVRLECQELERFSIVNRLAKFHGRTHPDAVEVSAYGIIPRRTFAQRHITALSVQGNLPDGVMCLSL